MNVLIIDDHELLRHGLALILKNLDPSIHVLEAKNLDESFQLMVQHTNIDLVLFDLGLPGFKGVEALQAFKQKTNHVPVVVLSGACDRATVMASLEAGAMGFIPKSASTQILWSALRLVLAKGIYIPPSILEAEGVITHYPAPSIAQLTSKKLSDLDLSKRQIDVFRLIMQGKSNKAIARDLGLTESTVKAHIKPILKSLQVSSRVQAILEIGRLGINLN